MKSGVILRKIILSHGKLVKRCTGKGHFRINLSMDEYRFGWISLWMSIVLDEYRWVEFAFKLVISIQTPMPRKNISLIELYLWEKSNNGNNKIIWDECLKLFWHFWQLCTLVFYKKKKVFQLHNLASKTKSSEL